MENTPNLTDSGAEKPKRKKPWLMWLVMLVVVCCLVAMNLRGFAIQGTVERVSIPGKPKMKQVCAREFGWPKKWGMTDRDIPLSTSNRIIRMKHPDYKSPSQLLFPWAIDSVNWNALILNVGVGILILGMVWLICRLRSKRGFRFSLLEAAICMTLVSLAFANYQHHRSVSEKENCSGSSTLNTRRVSHLAGTTHKWMGPSWLRALIGRQEWMNVYYHVDRLIFECSRNGTRTVGEIENFQFASEVKMLGDPTIGEIESLGQLNRLKNINVETFSSAFNYDYVPTDRNSVLFSAQAYTPRLEPFARRSPRPGMRHGESFEQRIKVPETTLASVVELSIDADPDTMNSWPRATDLLRLCPNLKKVSVIGPQFIPDDLMQLPPSIESEWDFT